MSHDNELPAITFFIGFGLGCLLMGLLLNDSGQTDERNRAIQAGVAHYTVDPKTGATQFVYVKPLEEMK